ncbi:MAG TPA: FliH/SctL family protein [Verrucomicrobiae bacterium]|jgi:flagellar biosynthesis/type III secretory pathway protein FliH|nr:FliH/SctL family protein [Verrucomicrobiae bacterium]
MNTSLKSGSRLDGRSEPATAPELRPFPYHQLPAGRAAISAAESSSLIEDASEPRALAQARQEGLASAQKLFEEKLSQERTRVVDAITGFSRDRATYFEKVESEVVQLALSIARKILHREAQVDPLLLAGIVRVELENIDGATNVKLRIHPQIAAEWRRYLSARLEPEDMPEIIEDPAQPPDRCSLETSMGSTVLGLEVQLKEIEQGLMDLVAARPKNIL